MSTPRSVCVFCGHSTGADPRHVAAATNLGRSLAERGIDLIYGGGRLGIMGAVAEAALTSGGRVIGIIPDFLMRMEAAYHEITEMIIVRSMETRKRMMMDRADAFCVLPGGFGTMDETFEVITQKQLGLLRQPLILLNTGGFFTPWRALADGIIGGGFATPETASLYTLVDSEADILPTMEAELARTEPLLRLAAAE
ncbi:MAG: TIGR00730 family Rossman fold protein [Alphaproteobacteria bacterium]